MTISKVCKVCDVSKDLSEFYVVAGNTDGRCKTCKECTKQQARDHREEISKGKKIPRAKMSLDIIERMCTSCKQVKSISEFSHHSTARVPYRSQCKKCINEKNKHPREEKVEISGEKTCFVCEISKPYSDFYHHPKGRLGLSARCRVCHTRQGTQNRRDHPEVIKGIKSRRRTRVVVNMSKEDKLKTIERRKEIKDDSCFYCGDITDNMTDDHFFPLAKGGTDHWWNIVRACGPCNFSKGPRCGICFMGTACYSACYPSLLEVIS